MLDFYAIISFGEIFMQIGWPELLLFAILLFILFSAASRPLGQILRAFLDGLSGKLDEASARGDPEKEGEGVNGNERPGERQPGGTAAEDPYKILNVPPSATREEIRSAYKELAQMYHPDKVESLAPEYSQIADQKMKAINAAYEQLQRRLDA